MLACLGKRNSNRILVFVNSSLTSNFVVDGSGNVVSPTDESSSQNVQAEEVQAPPESKDLNENVVEAPTANAGNKEVGIQTFSWS